LRSASGTISEIRSAVIKGNTQYYLRLDGNSGGVFRASAADIPIAPLLNVGERVTVVYRDTGVGQFWTDAYDVSVG
ncbi:MAG: hypothetical protein J6M06_02755, partial [Synergistaceae bacterium]|nr:hypothetical protein [Synergistaceae bacterium]